MSEDVSPSREAATVGQSFVEGLRLGMAGEGGPLTADALADLMAFCEEVVMRNYWTVYAEGDDEEE